MRLLMIAALVLLARPALAAQRCGDLDTQTAMNVCADKQYRSADKALNAAYRALQAKITPAGRDALQKAQRAWVAYRDAECGFETLGTAGGSINPFVLSQCLEGLTRAQTQALAAQAHCQEGDLSCGGQ